MVSIGLVRRWVGFRIFRKINKWRQTSGAGGRESKKEAQMMQQHGVIEFLVPEFDLNNVVNGPYLLLGSRQVLVPPIRAVS